MNGNEKMTPRERMLALYRGESADHSGIGITEGGLPFGSDELETRLAGVGLIYSIPVATTLAPGNWDHEITLSEVRGVEQKIEYHWEGTVRKERKSFCTPVGELSQEMSVDFGKGMDRLLSKRYISSLDDYKILEYIIEHTVFTPNKDVNWYTTRTDLGGAGIWMGELDTSPYWKLMYQLAGADRFLEDLETNTEVVESLIDVMTEKSLEQAAYLLDYPADIFYQKEDADGKLITTERFNKYCLPIYQKIAALAEQTGNPYVLRLGSGMDNLLNELSRAGVSGVEVPLGMENQEQMLNRAVNGMKIHPLLWGAKCKDSDEAIDVARQLWRTGNSESYLLRVENFSLQQRKDILPILCSELISQN